jgi:predicted NUDIX family phosphoesterase
MFGFIFDFIFGLKIKKYKTKILESPKTMLDKAKLAHLNHPDSNSNSNSNNSNNLNNLALDKFNEQILVVARENLKLDWQGLKTNNLADYLEIIKNQREFKARGLMEQDENYKQIIPYMIFKFEEQLFLMQRATQASEERLKNKFTLGIGGHVRELDLNNLSPSNLSPSNLNNYSSEYRQNNNSYHKNSISINKVSENNSLTGEIFAWAEREFHEEIKYTGNLNITTLGLLNDDSNSVGRVHLGLVLLLQGDNPEIKIKSELQAGFLCQTAACGEFLERMESWSQIVFEELWLKNLC